MTNSQPIVIRVAKKPISTLAQPLASVNLKTKQAESASYERSDVCAVAAASCILENVVAMEIAAAVVEKFGGDNLEEIRHAWTCSTPWPERSWRPTTDPRSLPPGDRPIRSPFPPGDG